MCAVFSLSWIRDIEGLFVKFVVEHIYSTCTDCLEIKKEWVTVEDGRKIDEKDIIFGIDFNSSIQYL